MNEWPGSCTKHVVVQSQTYPTPKSGLVHPPKMTPSNLKKFLKSKSSLEKWTCKRWSQIAGDNVLVMHTSSDTDTENHNSLCVQPSVEIKIPDQQLKAPTTLLCGEKINTISDTQDLHYSAHSAGASKQLLAVVWPGWCSTEMLLPTPQGVAEHVKVTT